MKVKLKQENMNTLGGSTLNCIGAMRP